MWLEAFIDGASVGYVEAAKITGGGWHLDNIKVEASHWRKNVGTALLAEMFKCIGEADCTLSVKPDNRAAVGFFKRAGFRFTSPARRSHQPHDDAGG